MNRITPTIKMPSTKPRTNATETHDDQITTLLNLQIPSSIQTSPSGTQILYTTALHLNHRNKTPNPISTIWLAETGKAGSARQLTSGLTNDTDPKWHPTDPSTLAFLSDRADPGKSSAIYLLSLKGGEAFPVTDVRSQRGIGGWAWSPCGKRIGFLSADEKTEGQKRREEEGDDGVVYGVGREWEVNRLRVLHVATRTVEVLVEREGHVGAFAWGEGGKEVVFTVQKTPELEAPWEGGTLEVLRLGGGQEEARVVCETWCQISSLVWGRGEVFFVSNADVDVYETSQALYSVAVDGGSGEWVRRAGGIVDCAQKAVRVGDRVLVQIQSGLDSVIRDPDGGPLVTEMTEFDSWHAVPSSSGRVVLAVAKSSTSAPTEVFSWEQNSSSSTVRFQQLSTHGEGIKSHARPPTVLSVKSSDGKVELDGLFLTPDDGSSGPWATVVHVHGGPYYRTTGTFMPGYGWVSSTIMLYFRRQADNLQAPYLLSAGYAIMFPNYRGGSGRGKEFASFSQGKTGTVDYDDIITLTQHCIEKKLIDKRRVMIGGWSQGGFLSYLTSVRNGTHGMGWKFAGAICGAGVTDEDTMALTSDLPSVESEFSGIAPWEAEKSDIGGRKGSAIWELADAAKAGRVPPVLILHGEQDVRVPVTQAWGFYRGCRKWKLSCDMVTYPREGHAFVERRHIVDLFQRVRKFCDLHIS